MSAWDSASGYKGKPEVVGVLGALARDCVRRCEPADLWLRSTDLIDRRPCWSIAALWKPVWKSKGLYAGRPEALAVVWSLAIRSGLGTVLESIAVLWSPAEDSFGGYKLRSDSIVRSKLWSGVLAAPRPPAWDSVGPGKLYGSCLS
jgi:hypothetical protein